MSIDFERSGGVAGGLENQLQIYRFKAKRRLASLVRDAKGLSQQAVADDAGVSRQTIGNLERGAVCNRTIARAVASTLGLPGDDETIESIESMGEREWIVIIQPA